MSGDGSLFRIAVSAPSTIADAIADAIEPFSIAVTVQEDGDAEPRRIEGLCAENPDREAVEIAVALALASHGGEAMPVAIEPVEDRDWLSENRETFAPFSVGRFFVHDAAYDGPVPIGQVGLRIDAGEAFGSGRHATTAGCLTALEGLSGHRVRRALDFGTGSGILAIAMAKRFRSPVIACDVDPRAVAVASANADVNGVGNRERVLKGDSYAAPGITKHRPYDLVTSNILARPLIRLAAGLARVTVPGGVAILAGFLVGDSNRVLAAHTAHGFRLVRRIDIDGWRTLVLRKR